MLEAEAPPQPDPIDRAAAKAREWAHAILVNSCVATKHLQVRGRGRGARVGGGAYVLPCSEPCPEMVTTVSMSGQQGRRSDLLRSF